MIEFICHFIGAVGVMAFVSDVIYQHTRLGKIEVPNWAVIFIVAGAVTLLTV